MKQILILGSLNIDLVQQVPRLPTPGETLKGSSLQLFPGGKGANQACAAAILSAGRHSVRMAGMLGNDVFAERLFEELNHSGVDAKWVRRANTATGSASIFVLPSGENTIVIAPGANGEVTAELALEAVSTLHSNDLLLCQLETPIPAVIAALKAARECGVTTILDPAPACPLPEDLFPAISILTPNQTEAATLTETTDIHSAAHQLRSRGVETVIVKLGADGCLLLRQGSAIHVPTFPVTAIDTTAAGDTFNGALAVAFAEDKALEEAARFANAAAALSVTKPGAIPSIPLRASVESLLTSCLQ